MYEFYAVSYIFKSNIVELLGNMTDVIDEIFMLFNGALGVDDVDILLSSLNDTAFAMVED